MKRSLGAFALLLTLVLTACTPKTPTAPLAASSGDISTPTPALSRVPEVPEKPEAFRFTPENMPGLDGSTSTVPYARAMCAVLLGQEPGLLDDYVRFSKTTQSYRNLKAAGGPKLLVAAEPPADLLAELEADDRWLITPFAMDALVFVVNEDNPVDNLTAEQVQKIYAGEITNWKEVGGPDLDIVPFQRNAEAGSQTMLKKLVMGDVPLMDPPTQWISGSMSGILEAVREYDNSSAALGYTVYYYANDMEMAKGLKVLSVDGVMPSAQAIRAGEYPYLNPYYVTIDKNAAADSPTRILYDWILGPGGQKLAEMEGYVPVNDVSGEDEAVWADWSVLGQESGIQPDVDGGRWYADYTGGLIPSEEYGALYPYVGEVAYRFDKWTDEEGNEYRYDHTDPSPLYGLMTRDGKIVTDPVYQSVTRVYSWDRGKRERLPVLCLEQSREEWKSGSNAARTAVIAEDGSWVTGFEFWGHIARGDELMLYGPEGLTQLSSRTGRREDWSWKKLGVPEEELEQTLMEIEWLYGLNWTDVGVFVGRPEEYVDENSKVRVFDPDEGQVHFLTVKEFEDALNRYYSDHWGDDRYWDKEELDGQVVLSRRDESHTFALPEGTECTSWQVAGDYASLSYMKEMKTHTCLFRLSDGALLLEGRDIGIHTAENDPEQVTFIQVIEEDGGVTLYRPDASLWLELPVADTFWVAPTLENDRLSVYADGRWFAFYDANSGERLFFRNLDMGD